MTYTTNYIESTTPVPEDESINWFTGLFRSLDESPVPTPVIYAGILLILSGILYFSCSGCEACGGCDPTNKIHPKATQARLVNVRAYRRRSTLYESNNPLSLV